MQKYNILIVEDELIPANYIKKILEKNGHHVIGIANSKVSAMEFVQSTIKLDLVLMDIKIKGKADGIETAKAICSYTSANIIFITAYSDTDFLQRAKDVHPIGYLVKPIQPGTLLSTIEVGMSQLEQAIKEKKIPLCNGIIFDIHNQILKKERKIIDLSHRETIILEALILNKNSILSVSELEDILFKIDYSGENALRTAIWRLRKKLPECISIKNIYNSGYKIKF